MKRQFKLTSFEDKLSNGKFIENECLELTVYTFLPLGH
jgi:hypothetical protein